MSKGSTAHLLPLESPKPATTLFTYRKMANLTPLVVVVLLVTIATLFVKNHNLNQEVENSFLAHGIAKKTLQENLNREMNRYMMVKRQMTEANQRVSDLSSKFKEDLRRSSNSLQAANDNIMQLKSTVEGKDKILESINEENRKIQAVLEEKKINIMETEEKLRIAEEELFKLRNNLKKAKEELQAARVDSEQNLASLKKFQDQYTVLMEEKEKLADALGVQNQMMAQKKYKTRKLYSENNAIDPQNTRNVEEHKDGEEIIEDTRERENTQGDEDKVEAAFNEGAGETEGKKNENPRKLKAVREAGERNRN